MGPAGKLAPFFIFISDKAMIVGNDNRYALSYEKPEFPTVETLFTTVESTDNTPLNV